MWRGVACLSVVVFHSLSGYIATPALIQRVRADGGTIAEWIVLLSTYMWMGVPLFFVISGYCITAAADSARRKPHPGLTFFWRRFRRIYPPLWAYLAIATIVVALLPESLMPGPTHDYKQPLPRPWDLKPAQWFGSITLTEEWREHIGGPPKRYFTGQLWTLCYEEQFYLLVGLIVMVARQWLFPLVSLITMLVFLNMIDLNTLAGARLEINLNAYQLHYPGFFFDGLWLAFAAGIGVYYRLNYATPLLNRCIDAMLLIGLFFAISPVPSIWELKQDVPGYLCVAFVGALLLGWLHSSDGTFMKARVAAPLRWAGQMCYSLYLVHGPVALFVQASLFRLGVTTPLEGLLITLPVSMAASLALGWVFHCKVERRFLNSPLAPTPSGFAANAQEVKPV